MSDVTRTLEANGTMGGALAPDMFELPAVWCEATQLLHNHISATARVSLQGQEQIPVGDTSQGSPARSVSVHLKSINLN